MLVHLDHPKRLQVGHEYNYARHVTPDHWRQFVDDETTVNIAFAVAHLYNGLCRIEAQQQESEDLLSNTRLKHDQLNASIAEKAAELAKERKEMQAKLVDQEKKLEKAVANHNRDIATLTDGKKTAEANFRTAQSQLEISRADSDRNTKEWTKEKKELETRVKELEFNVTKLKKEKASAAQAQELKTANQRVTAAQGETRKKEQELAAARTNAAKFEREAEEATADNRELREKVKELKAELKGAQQAAAKSQAAAAARPAPQSAPGPDPALQMKLKQTEEELDKVNRQFRQERARMNGLCGNHLENPSVSDQDLAALQTVHKKGLIALADEWHRRRLPFDQWTLREGLAEPYFTQQPSLQQPCSSRKYSSRLYSSRKCSSSRLYSSSPCSSPCSSRVTRLRCGPTRISRKRTAASAPPSRPSAARAADRPPRWAARRVPASRRGWRPSVRRPISSERQTRRMTTLSSSR